LWNNNNAAKCFDILVISLNVLHNYFDGPKQNYYLYLAKLLDSSAKLFFHVKIK